MFVVKQVKRGWFRDQVFLVASADAELSRRQLGWDVAGAPEVQEERMQVQNGQEFVVSLTRGLVTEGHSISQDQAIEWDAFNKYWKPATA